MEGINAKYRGLVMFFEPIPLITVHSERLAFVRIIGSNMHFALAVSQPGSAENAVEQIINHRQSMPLVGVVEALPLVIATLAQTGAFNTAELARKLVEKVAAYRH
jgi:hypothetical protein